jgi:hypothetical protein
MEKKAFGTEQLRILVCRVISAQSYLEEAF